MTLKNSYLALISSQHRGRPKYMSTIEKLLDPMDGVFEAAVYFDDAFDLELAFGTQQEVLGDIVGQRRELGFAYQKDGSSLLNDTEYRVMQKAKIIRNLWNGKIEDLYEKWLALFGAPINIQDHQDMTMSVHLKINESDEMQKLMKLTAHGLIVPKPMGVGINFLFYYPPIYLPVNIRHQSAVTQNVEGKHNPWNLGKVRTVRFDGEFAMDRAIRWDGIYGEAYRQRQQHHVELWYNIEAWQRNLAPVNVWDGDFPMDGSHTWSGMAMLRLPLHKSSSRGSVAARHTRANEWNNRIFAMNCPDVYLPNTVKFNSDSMQAVVVPQKVASRQVSKCLESVIAPQAQKRRQKTAVMQNQQTAEEINIEYRAAIASQVIARRNADYRFANLADGSFCMDGTHTFNGTRQQNYAQAGHCCSIARVTEKGIGRIELA